MAETRSKLEKTTSSNPVTGSNIAAGPLVVAAANPRYFTIRSGNGDDRRAIYLTGSHIWNNFHDGMGPGAECAAIPELFDYNAYLTFLQEHDHNFICIGDGQGRFIRRWQGLRSL